MTYKSGIVRKHRTLFGLTIRTLDRLNLEKLLVHKVARRRTLTGF